MYGLALDQRPIHAQPDEGLLVSLASASVPSTQFPGCFINVDLGAAFLGGLDLRVGSNIRWELPLPSTLGAATIYFQDWYTDAAVSRFFSTRRLAIPLVK